MTREFQSSCCPSTCKLSADDWREIRQLDRLLERDLYVEWAARQLTRWEPAPEVLATAKNPSMKELQAERFALGLSRYAGSTVSDGWRLIPFDAPFAIRL